jgi:hypothetical protein
VVWIAALVCLAAALVGGWFVLKKKHGEHLTDQQTACLDGKKPPQAALFLVDATDRLTPDTAERVVQEIRDTVSRMPRYSRVIVVPFGDDTAQPLKTQFSKCLPGRGKEAGFDESPQFVEQAYAAFDRSLAGLKDQLQSLPDSKTSPIAEQVVRAVSDPVLHWEGDQRTLILVTDGLETGVYRSGDLKLPDPKPQLLEYVKVDYFEVGNTRAGKLQSDDLRRRWKAWFEKAGSTVRMIAPGYTS